MLFGAKPEMAALDLQDSLKFEIKLADITSPREKRRDFSRQHNPMHLREMEGIAPFIDWKKYVNNVLTEGVLQVLKTKLYFSLLGGC